MPSVAAAPAAPSPNADSVSPVAPVSTVSKPYTGWYRQHGGEMVEGSTGDVYNDDDTFTIRTKCAALVLGNLTVNAVNLCETVGWRSRKVVNHFREGRVDKGMRNLGMVFASPAIWIGMEGAALIGLAAPLHGRKWWGRMESHMKWELAPCFQPLQDGGEPPLTAEELKARGYKQHLLGVQVGRARW